MNRPLSGDAPEQAGLRVGRQAKGGGTWKRSWGLTQGFHGDLTPAAEGLSFETESRLVPRRSGTGACGPLWPSARGPRSSTGAAAPGV